MNKYLPAESVTIVKSGEDYFSRLDTLIRNAKETLHIQVYIFDADHTGKRIANALKAAAANRVKVFVLADAFGSFSLTNEFIEDLKKAGIHFRFFSPLFSSESIYLGRRLHHKIAVADKKTALVGGINISDKYHGTKEEKAWFDLALEINGDVCSYLDDLCRSFYEKKRFFKVRDPIPDQKGKVPIRFRRNDWIRGLSEVRHSYRELITGAEKNAIIVASYFLPGYFQKMVLRKARKRGLKIKLILAGKSDLPLFMYAEKYLYRFLLRHGIELYELPKSVLHGKAIVTDAKAFTIGSYNVNYLSHYRSIELNVDVKEEKLGHEFANYLEGIIKTECVQVNAKEYQQKETYLAQFRNFLAYLYLLLVMKILLPKRGRRKQDS